MSDPSSDPAPTGLPAPDERHRPLVERIGRAAIALVLGVLFVVFAVAAFIGGEPFLGVMSAIGALMVAWAGGRTLLGG